MQKAVEAFDTDPKFRERFIRAFGVGRVGLTYFAVHGAELKPLRAATLHLPYMANLTCEDEIVPEIERAVKASFPGKDGASCVLLTMTFHSDFAPIAQLNVRVSRPDAKHVAHKAGKTVRRLIEGVMKRAAEMAALGDASVNDVLLHVKDIEAGNFVEVPLTYDADGGIVLGGNV